MLTIIRTTSDNPDFIKLTNLLDRELWERYDEEQAEYDGHNKIENNKTVVIAYLDNYPVGSACIKTIDVFTVEVKRMFVRKQHRGKGIAMALLSEIEIWASQLSFKNIILETGVKQPEAIALYRKAGYDIIPNYEPYVGMKSSVCMGKRI